MQTTPENLARMPVANNLRGMDAPENLRPTLAGLSPRQRRLLAGMLAFAGMAMFWRVAQAIWPSTGLAIAGVTAYTVGIVSVMHFLNSIPRYRPALPWCAGTAVGGMLNLIVMVANGGYMPCPLNETIIGIYVPVAGANLVHLCDWIWGFVSPGDVIMAVASVGVAVVMVRQWRAK